MLNYIIEYVILVQFMDNLGNFSCVFLDIHHYYDYLDRERCIDILVGYTVGTQSLRLIHRYWGRLAIVEIERIYHRDPSKG